MSDFRKEVFAVCKKLQKTDESKAIHDLIYDMSVRVENEQTGFCKETLHGNFAYLAKEINMQFYGFLLIDNNNDIQDLITPFSIENLSDSERFVIERGNNTLTRFVGLCLDEIKAKSSVVGEAISPYFLYAEVDVNPEASSILPDKEFADCVKAFKEGKVVQTLMQSQVLKIFNKIDINSMRDLMGSFEREMSKSYGDNVSDEIEKFFLKNKYQYNNMKDIMYAACILFFSLKESLRMACQLFYEAICGMDLLVLNNDNIINIESQKKDAIGDKLDVLMQGICINPMARNIGRVLLIDCDSFSENHIHEFGMITATTEHMTCDMGNTTRFSLLTTDEELINIHNLTDQIIDAGFPNLVERNL